MEEKVILKVEVQGEKANQGLKDVDNSLNNTKKGADNAKGSIKGLDDALDNIPGAAGEAAQGVKGLLGQFKALVATPIGIAITAIVAVFGSLYAIFKDFSPLVDFVSDKLARLGGMFQGLRTIIFSFTEGLDVNTNAIKEQGDAAERANQMLRDYEDTLDSFNLKQAQYEAQIDKLIKQSKNKALTDKEAMALIQQASKLQDKQIADLKKNQRDETAILVEKAKAAGATYDQILALKNGADLASLGNLSETLDKELKLLINNYEKRVKAVDVLDQKKEKINNAASIIDEKRKAREEKAEADRQKKKEDALRQEEEANKKREIFIKDNEERAKELADKEKKQEENDRQRKRSLLESEREEYAANIEDLKSIKDDEILAAEERFAAIDELNKKGVLSDKQAADAKIEIAKKEKEARIVLLESYSSILSATAELVGKDTAKGKALAVASATISTYAAIAKNLSAFAGVPIPGYAIAQSIATGLAGFAAIKNILSVQVPGGDNGGGSAPQALAPVVRPSSSFTQLGNTEPIRTTNEGGKVKVFVTESDITATQEKVGSIKAKATIQ
jgi:hypothetical protein